MHPLQITMIISMTTMLLISALFFLIRNMPSRPGIKWWISASLIQSYLFLCAVIHFGNTSSILETFIFYCFQMAAIQCLSIGTLLFAGISININKRLSLLIITSTICISAISQEHLFLASLFLGAYQGFYLIHTGYSTLRINDHKNNCKIVAVLMILMGVHWFDYPFLSTIEWFVPIGFLIGAIILSGIFLNLVVLALSQFKIHTQDSERRAIEASTRDSLTGLYNRSYLDTLFDNYVKEAKQLERTFILLYFDLDDFKQINDTYGHKAGDLILKTVAKRMTEWLGTKGDAIRIGGDELIVLTRLSGVYNRENAEIAARHLLNVIEKPIIDGQNTYHISASIGGCCYGLPYYSLDDMLNKADKFMYIAKQAGGKQIFFCRRVSSINQKINSNKAITEKRENFVSATSLANLH